MFQINKVDIEASVRSKIVQLIALLLFSVFVALIVPVAANAESEGKDSGGGGVVLQVGPNLILVDVLNILSLPEAIVASAGAGDRQISNGHAFKIGEAAPENSSFSEASKLLRSWEFAIAAQVGLKTIQWEFDDYVNRKTSFFSPMNVANATPVLAAYYSTNLAPKNGMVSVTNATYYRVILNRQLWNRLSTFSQVGLILHETLRQVQFGFLARYNDEVLQKVTAMMLLCKPSSEANKYLFLALSNMMTFAELNVGSYRDITKNCAAN